ncbi:hypothetical protein ACLMJK_005005 [Lecanora helva]
MPLRTIPQESMRRSKSSSSSDYSESSDHSISTAPTDHSVRPSVNQYSTPGNPYDKDEWDLPEYDSYDYGDQRASRETCASSISTDDNDHDREAPPYYIPDNGSDAIAPSVLAASPQEFADYFPSTQRLCIRHDDCTMDGNMNLRIDTKARTYDGGEVDLTLFHLRMHDLKRREFSLRRYCRESGREICHSSRKYSKPSVVTRPGLQRSMSSAFSSLRPKSEHKSSAASNLKRHDSGYDSLHEDELDDEGITSAPTMSSSMYIPTNTTRLEFSNYTHLEVKRRGTKGSKRYDFEYWGVKYAWKRLAVASGNFKEISYHLYNTKTSASLAHIVPIPQSSADLREESAKGGWVPPCAMMLEESVNNNSADLADVIVASGLIALVDDCIKTRWHQKGHVHMSVPALNKSHLRMNMEYVGPKRLVDEVFHRRSKESPRRPTPL